MLPHKLSNGICSLNEKQDRLALSCLMTIDKKGNVIDHEIVESVICTNARMTYTAVNAIIDKHDEEVMRRYEDLCDMFFTMKELADILRHKRKLRGSIDFDLPESKIILDENSNVTDIKPYERNAATKLIEDFMLIANETVAEHFYFLELPFVYRVHEKPESDKINKLASFIRGFGYGLKMKGEEVHPKELQKLLSSIADTPEEALISRLTLRSMQRAKYSTNCGGHYGLACEYYCHFTSPIRRYPDLQIHRIIKDFIHGRMNEDKIMHYNNILDEVASNSSSRERLADEAERETDKLKKCQYMERRIGYKYTGIISGVTNWGIYVELDNTCEGLIHISKIPGDYYYYDEKEYKLIGESTKRTFSLGHKIDIIVNGVDMISKTIDFIIDEEAEELT
ncbi:MAG: VacB/RNase II family 3'-5' exoribonuclease, partial [Lachnospiraceae bacterium]|nr:VacB/RNase II family 3'-5' exoribonuclease [Lachnospiraceae bacterium]